MNRCTRVCVCVCLLGTNRQGESIILYNQIEHTTEVCMPEQAAMS